MPHRHNPLLYLSGTLSAVWVFVAFLNPDNNYVLFPFLIAGAVPVSYRLAWGGPVERPVAIAGALAGVATVALVSLLLGLSGKRHGPPILPVGGQGVGALLLAILGAAVGTVVAGIGAPRS